MNHRRSDRIARMRAHTQRNLRAAQRATNRHGIKVHSVYLGTDPDGLATYRLA